ncbi:Hypothetical protein PBC10988_38080 [Planctomycetales bacterium 10988]|nr:Hypothetical protein PBC10988_38080 [Planctomycetales bacterium 10988]
MRLTIRELTKSARWLLEQTGYSGADSGRVRDLPDERTLRYYANRGLFDRPLEMRGRTAFYGRKHLYQVVAIKQMQAAGMDLETIQDRLLGATDAQLKAWSKISDEALERIEQETLEHKSSVAQSPPEKPSSHLPEVPKPRHRTAFWDQEASENHPSTFLESAEVPRSDSTSQPKTLLEIPLAPGVRLQIEGANGTKWGPQEQSIISPLIQVLLQTLRRLGVLSDDNQR